MDKCVIVSDSFKGTLSSREICQIARQAIGQVFPGCSVRTIPAADGGEGTVDSFVEAIGARRVSCTASGPYGEPITAEYAVFGDTAVIEMAATAGLPLVGSRRDPTRTTTYGVGEMLLHAVRREGCRHLLLGLGGSCTTDGGCGCAAALGVKFLDAEGRSFVPTGGSLSRIAAICTDGLDSAFSQADLIAMCDVSIPLCGPNGSAAVFAPQKGASVAQVRLLDEGLQNLSERIRKGLHKEVENLAGAGAGGGMGAGCAAFFGAELRSGTEAILDAAGFSDSLIDTDLVITGEGRVDGQSFRGKLLSSVLRRTQKAGVPVVILAGGIGEGAEAAYECGVIAMAAVNRAGLPAAQLAGRAAEDYRNTILDVLRLIRRGEQLAEREAERKQ